MTPFIICIVLETIIGLVLVWALAFFQEPRK